MTENHGRNDRGRAFREAAAAMRPKLEGNRVHPGLIICPPVYAQGYYLKEDFLPRLNPARIAYATRFEVDWSDKSGDNAEDKTFTEMDGLDLPPKMNRERIISQCLQVLADRKVVGFKKKNPRF